jgi:hypothetical protein
MAETVVEPVTASDVVVAPANVAPPLKAISVVVALLGNGYAAVSEVASDELDTLLLKLIQSVVERQPACEPLAVLQVTLPFE